MNRSAKMLIPKFGISLKLLVFGAVSIISAQSLSLNLNQAWAAVIQCPTGPAFECIGTTDPDTMRGTDNPDRMEGRDGDDSMSGLGGNDDMSGDRPNLVFPLPIDDDDQMNGGSGGDHMVGGIGDDTMDAGSGNDLVNGFLDDALVFTADDDEITGGSANDEIQGSGGFDILNGASGNDIIYHAADFFGTGSDGRVDTITCGSGQDEAFINVSDDGDTAASDCEIVHAG